MSSACLPPSVRSRVALPLALRVSAPLTPLLGPPRDAPLPARATAAPVRVPAATASFCALACRRVLFLPCCCAALSHAPQSRRALPCRSPCRPRAGLVTSRHLPLVLPLFTCVFALRLPCCCGCALRTYARSPRRVPTRFLHRPSLDLWHSRSLHLRAPWLFTCSLRCWRSALARQCRLRPLCRRRPRALRRLAISAAAALRSSAPLARTVLAALRLMYLATL